MDDNIATTSNVKMEEINMQECDILNQIEQSFARQQEAGGCNPMPLVEIEKLEIEDTDISNLIKQSAISSANSHIVDPPPVDRTVFYSRMKYIYTDKNHSKRPWNTQQISEIIKTLTDTSTNAQHADKKINQSFNKTYDVIEIRGTKEIVKKQSKPARLLRIIPMEEFYDILAECHLSTSHGNKETMELALKFKFAIPSDVIQLFISCCKLCTRENPIQISNVTAEKPVLDEIWSDRGQIELIDLQSMPDGEYKWLLNYQDLVTKFVHLRPLKSNQIEEVADELLKIFLQSGAPKFLQSENGLDFLNAIIQRINLRWPSCKLISGHLQKLPCNNQDVENMLKSWLLGNNSRNWSLGCFFVQWIKNSSRDRETGKTPYSAVFGVDFPLGLRTANLSLEVIDSINTEEELEKAMAAEQKRVFSVDDTEVNGTSDFDYDPSDIPMDLFEEDTEGLTEYICPARKEETPTTIDYSTEQSATGNEENPSCVKVVETVNTTNQGSKDSEENLPCSENKITKDISRCKFTRKQGYIVNEKGTFKMPPVDFYKNHYSIMKKIPFVLLDRNSIYREQKKKWSSIFCYFCKKEVKKFPRHIQRCHRSEEEVQQILQYKVNHPTRKKLLTLLRNKGNYIINKEKCVKPIRRATIAWLHNDYAPCKYCYGFYTKKYLYRHVRVCVENPGEKTAFSYLSDSQDFLTKDLPVDKQLRQLVFPRMMGDDVSLEAKKDSLICDFGARYLRKNIGTMNMETKNIISVTSRKMRELGKVLIQIKETNPDIKNLSDSLRPDHFDLVIEAMKTVCNYDNMKQEFSIKSTALSIQLSLKQCCDIAAASNTEEASMYRKFRQLLQDTCPIETRSNIVKTTPVVATKNEKCQQAALRSPEKVETRKVRTPRILVPWTHEQKTFTKSFFEYHIENKIPPKKHDCEELVEKYPGVFDNKTWPQIKVFVQNEYTKKKSFSLSYPSSN